MTTRQGLEITLEQLSASKNQYLKIYQIRDITRLGQFQTLTYSILAFHSIT